MNLLLLNGAVLIKMDFLATPEEALEKIKKHIEETKCKVIFMTNGLNGQAYAPSKKTPLFRLPLAVTERVFAEPDRRTLSTMTGPKGVAWYALVFLNDEHVNPDLLQKKLEECKTTAKTGQKSSSET